MTLWAATSNLILGILQKRSLCKEINQDLWCFPFSSFISNEGVAAPCKFLKENLDDLNLLIRVYSDDQIQTLLTQYQHCWNYKHIIFSCKQNKQLFLWIYNDLTLYKRREWKWHQNENCIIHRKTIYAQVRYG